MQIRIEGANEHNLKDVDVEIGDGLTVVTGVSGSGKTSLVFDTLYHEARRRFQEVFSLGERLTPADVRAVTGVGPAVAVGQNLLNRNPGSTLATASGLHPFLRLLYTHFGERTCAECGTPVSVNTEDEILERLVALSAAGPLTIVAPLLRQAQGSHRTLLAMLGETFGTGAVRVDGATLADRMMPELEVEQPHDIDVVIARLGSNTSVADVRDTLGTVWALGANAVSAIQDGDTLTLSRAPVCIRCGTWFGDLSPVLFHQSCPTCDGKGCEACGGTGLHPAALTVRWQGLRLPELLSKPVLEVQRRFATAAMPSTAARLRAEIARRLEALVRVGLGYVALDRPSPTLSRGESQRVRLAVALTSRLEDIVHVLDEPTIGLHQRDTHRLIGVLRRLVDLDNTVLVIEHDLETIAAADWVVDFGPGAGKHGGQVVAEGTPTEVAAHPGSLTGAYLAGRKSIAVPPRRREPNGKAITIRGARHNNLQNITARLPLGLLVAVTGVSGSGKSSLIFDVLDRAARQRLYGSGEIPGVHESIDGLDLLDKIITIDQAHIGRIPRSNAATYSDAFTPIREAFAATPDARRLGLKARHFSFNVPGGRCPRCEGTGVLTINMHFMPDVEVRCPACRGRRFTREVLEVKYRDHDISEVLDLTVEEALPLFEGVPSALARLQVLADVGLGYLQLGQPATTLSGGEAQRVKLAKELGRRATGRALYLLDEPTTGLHLDDTARLLGVLQRLVAAGNSVIVVEHNLELVKTADWVIDLGPEGGAAGGRIIAEGTPEQIAGVAASYTGKFLKQIL